MSETLPTANDITPLIENATLADLKAKKDRQRVGVAGPPTVAAPIGTASPEPRHVELPSASPLPARKPSRPDRAGKVLIAGYFPIATAKALKHIGVDEGLTLQQVMADAFTLYLKSKRPLP